MYLKLAWRNIWRNKRRSIITIVSITFAVLLACTMRSMQLGSYERMIENSARFFTGYIQVHQNGFWDDRMVDNSMSEDAELIQLIEQTEGVEVAVPRVESFALASYGMKTKGAMVLGIDPEKEDQLTLVKSKMIEGEYLKPDDKAVLVAEGLAEYLKVGIGDSLVLISQGYHGANSAGIYPIKGIMKFNGPIQNDQTVYIPLAESQWFYAMEGRLTSIALVIDKAKHVDRIVTSISNEVDTAQLEVMGWEELMPEIVQGIEVDDVSGRIMLWILYAVIGFGMFGTFLMMTAERMYEFGVMVSIGMRKWAMQVVIILEMGIMSAFGVIAGILISLPALIYFYNNPVFFGGEMGQTIESFGYEAAYFFSVDAVIFYNQAWAIFIMATILGFYPIYVIRKLKPVSAMREA